MGVFDINGKFFKTLTKAGDFIILTLLAMVCSIPVITIGASLTAVFYAALKMARDEEGYVWKEFFKSFKQNLKQSILIELILAAFAAILLVDINVCAKWRYAGTAADVCGNRYFNCAGGGCAVCISGACKV